MNNQREKKRKVSCHGCACSYSYEPCHKDTNKIPIPKKISVPIQGSYQSPPPSPTNEPETMIPPPKSKRHNNDIKEHERMGWSSKNFTSLSMTNIQTTSPNRIRATWSYQPSAILVTQPSSATIFPNLF